MIKEVVLIIGYPAAGKTTITKQYTDAGYDRLNRDIVGGSINNLAVKADQLLTSANNSIVLDNTYPTVESRKSIVAVAKKHKVPIKCVWLDTSYEDAQLNACLRMVQLAGGLVEPNDYNDINNPNLFPPTVLFRYRKEFQRPTTAEGFDQVTRQPFVRVWPINYTNQAILLDFDGTLRESTGKYKFPVTPKDIKIMPRRTEVLKSWQRKGYALFGVSNQSGVAKKQLTMEQCDDCFKATIKQLGVTMFYKFCPHNVPPIVCYCRKPHVGLGAYFIENFKLRPDKCIMVGDQGSDKTFAIRSGFAFVHSSEFFK